MNLKKGLSRNNKFKKISNSSNVVEGTWPINKGKNVLYSKSLLTKPSGGQEPEGHKVNFANNLHIR